MKIKFIFQSGGSGFYKSPETGISICPEGLAHYGFIEKNEKPSEIVLEVVDAEPEGDEFKRFVLELNESVLENGQNFHVIGSDYYFTIRSSFEIRNLFPDGDQLTLWVRVVSRKI